MRIKRSNSTNGETLVEKINRIRNGNIELRNNIIQEYKPFILKCVSHTLNHKFISTENCDEYSIGLIAFNEAIEKFDLKKGCNFLEFAQLVITRRIINYRIKNKNENYTMPFTYFEDDNGNSRLDPILTRSSKTNYEMYETKEEILDFKQKLKEFGISMIDLVDSSPKHKDAITSCINIARKLYENDSLYKKFLLKKSLPISEIVKITNLSRRTIERNRKYIIAAALIFGSNLDIMKEFLKNSG